MKFLEVKEKDYMEFINWAKENIEGLHSYSIMVADRIVVKDVSDNLIAYVNLAYETTYHVEEEVLKKWSK